MSKDAADKIAKSLNEVLAAAQCRHAWKRTDGKKHMKVKTCLKCGVRLIQHK